jgi:hypothetical protein
MTKLIIMRVGEYWCVARPSTQEEQIEFKYPRFIPFNATMFSSPVKAWKELQEQIKKGEHEVYSATDEEIRNCNLLNIKEGA